MWSASLTFASETVQWFQSKAVCVVWFTQGGFQVDNMIWKPYSTIWIIVFGSNVKSTLFCAAAGIWVVVVQLFIVCGCLICYRKWWQYDDLVYHWWVATLMYLRIANCVITHRITIVVEAHHVSQVFTSMSFQTASYFTGQGEVVGRWIGG